MTPERWQKVKQIFQRALDRPPNQRAAFLSEVCADDEALRQEVQSLIQTHEQDGSFIDSPAYAAAADLLGQDGLELKTGQTIGSFKILSFISRGGMGDVYLAQDQRLNRKVALKVLPASFTRDADRLARFEREARAASALNHPNIITIYEIVKTESTHLIATEYVDGETLRQRLLHSAPSFSEALHIAIQIADALTAAHHAGIVHRDIKPENIMLRPDGYVKVLDFGLAKLAEPASPAAASEAPTRPVRTGSGMILGTAGYMSPEQARGKSVDTRSDIFSLGAVIYEMVTGRQPFTGETASDILAAILKSEPPPLNQFASNAPPELIRIVTKALRKDREERYQVVKDLLLDLKALKEELDFQAKLDRSVAPTVDSLREDTSVQRVRAEASAAGTDEIRAAVSTLSHSLSTQIKRHKTGTAIAVIGLLLALLVGVVAVYELVSRRPKTPPQPAGQQVLRNTQVTFMPGLAMDPALSPDGNSVAYCSDQTGKSEIYVKQLTPGGREIQLTGDGQENLEPAWSPDGQRIAYYSRSRGGIWIVPALGGIPRQLTDFGSWPSWSHDSQFVAFQSGTYNPLPPSTIWIVAAEGGTPKRITQAGTPLGGHGNPAWSPDGKRIVFTAADYLTSNLWSIAVGGNDLKQLGTLGLTTSSDNSAVFSSDGQTVYVPGFFAGNYGLVSIAISPKGDAIGEPTMVMAFPGKSIRHVSLSADGKKLAYASLDILSTLTSLPMSPQSNEPVGPPLPLSTDRSDRHVAPDFSPDGRRIAFGQFREGTGADVWLIDADGKNLIQITTDSAKEGLPGWFPEGDRLEFFSDRNGHFTPWSINLTSGKENLLIDLGPGLGGFGRMSPDGKQIAYNSAKSGPMNVWIANFETGQVRQMTFDSELVGFPCWSPDGKLIAVEMKRGANQYLMIMPSEGGPLTQLTFEPGLSWPHDWSHDGDKIAFAGQRDDIWNIYWISRTTKEQKQLTHYSKLNQFVRYPAWSPLGNQIVFELAETTGNIWVMELK